MKQITIDIDWMDHNFAATVRDERIACVATGKTLDDVKKNMVDALRFHLEGMRAHHETIPADYAGEWEPSFVLTTRAQLRYSENYITRSALSRETGINVQQLSHYANGWKKPRPRTQQKIADGILSISRRLALI